MTVRPLPKALQFIAEQELNEVPNRIQDDVNNIKNWLATQVHLKARTDDQFLLTFLRTCKFSLERTKEKLDSFYSMRTEAPEFCRDRDPFLPAIEYFFKNNIIVIGAINEGEPVRVIARLGACDPDRVAYEDGVKYLFMLFDIILEETDNCQIAGINLIVDYEGVTYKHVLAITPNAVRKTMNALQNSYPMRIKSIVIINLPSVAVALYKLIQTLVSKKIKDRLHAFVDDGGDALYGHIPQTVLPNEYGGQGGSLSELTEKWNFKVKKYKEWFMNDEKFYSDETKRPQNSTKVDNGFGTDGSFRKLNVD